MFDECDADDDVKGGREDSADEKKRLNCPVGAKVAYQHQTIK